MKALLSISLILLSSFGFSQNQADEFYDPADMQNARDKMKLMGGGQTNFLILAERLEYAFHDDAESFIWDTQGWIGNDLRKLWIKTEGEYDLDLNATEEFELQALYSHGVSPFWNLQVGLRHDFEPEQSRDYAVLGIQGLAPYWFELDLAAFVSDEGKLSSRLTGEYELRFTQRLVLQPRMELNYSFSEDLAIDSGKGINKAQLGLRLRYEVKKEIAPYIGVSWEKAYGDTAALLNSLHKGDEQFSARVGIRLWY